MSEIERDGDDDQNLPVPTGPGGTDDNLPVPTGPGDIPRELWKPHFRKGMSQDVDGYVTCEYKGERV